MDTSIVSVEDMEYLAGQSAENMNIILSAMTALMDENNEKVEMLETQTWFQRMSKTISGKNKMTQAEIQQNHDKINMYLSQAMSELFERSYIDQQIIMSLGTRLNELYADHIQLKQMLGAFADKLNQKIISIDNFHMLETEIEQGIYDSLLPVSAMCKILSQLDNRTLNDSRKLDIIERSIRGKGIISEDTTTISKYLMALLNTEDREIGIIYIELETLGNNIIASTFKDAIENYHFLSGLSRKMRKKEEVVKKVIQQNQLDDTIELSLEDIYHELLNAKIMTIPQIKIQETTALEIEEMNDELQNVIEAFLNYSKKETMELLTPLMEKEDGFALYLASFWYQCIPEYKDVEMCNDCRERGHIAGNVLASIRYAKVCKDSNKAEAIMQANMDELKRMVMEGNLFAQYEYAVLCSESSSFKIPHDDGVDVRELLEKSSEQGFWFAKFQLARRYRYGIDGDTDYEKAFKLFSELDRLGMLVATALLADFYKFGLFVEENEKMAVKLYEKAAESEPEAKRQLAVCYRYGTGVCKDSEKATELYDECIDSCAKDILLDFMQPPLIIKLIRDNYTAAMAAYGQYTLMLEKEDESCAGYLYISAKCGNPDALYECAKCYLAEDMFDYLKKFPEGNQLLGVAKLVIPYDMEAAKYCLEEAKKRTKDEELLSNIEWIEKKYLSMK